MDMGKMGSRLPVVKFTDPLALPSRDRTTTSKLEGTSRFGRVLTTRMDAIICLVSDSSTGTHSPNRSRGKAVKRYGLNPSDIDVRCQPLARNGCTLNPHSVFMFFLWFYKFLATNTAVDKRTQGFVRAPRYQLGTSVDDKKHP